MGIIIGLQFRNESVQLIRVHFEESCGPQKESVESTFEYLVHRHGLDLLQNSLNLVRFLKQLLLQFQKRVIVVHNCYRVLTRLLER